MQLLEALRAAGLSPPEHIAPGRWIRFPGIGKGRSNRAAWCRIITPTLAIYGDWSNGLSGIWRDDTHRDDAESARLLREARERERGFAKEQRVRQEKAAEAANRLMRAATLATHPYLARKGFPQMKGLVVAGKLLVSVRDALDYGHVTSVQEIDGAGEKRFLSGGRTRGCVHRLGPPPSQARKVVLCEGYATGLSLDAALSRLPGPHTVVVCFSATNLEIVAEHTPRAIVCADNDASKTGEVAATRTGLPWTMPLEVGTDFNDLHQRSGVPAVVDLLRRLWA
jgi:putative DNA primase/helicase